LLDQKGQEVLLVILVYREFLVKMELLVPLVREERLVNMALKETLEYLVLLVLLGQQESLVRLESQESLEHPVFLENPADLVNQEKKDLQGHTVLKAGLVYPDHLVCQVSLEKEVYLDFRYEESAFKCLN
jgi:hypothetical protein